MDIVILNSGPPKQPIVAGSSVTPPPVVHRTLGPYKLAHICRKENYTVKVIDHVNFFSCDELVLILRKFIDKNTKVLGISTTFLISHTGDDINSSVFDAIEIISKEFPDLKIISGGAYAGSLKHISKFNIYAIIRKYAEDIFRDVVNHIFGRCEEPRYTIEFNAATKKTIKVYEEPLYKNFNIEEEDFLFHKDDCIVLGETLPLEISRGCIFKCKFCNHLMLGRGKLDYLRNFELIKNELIHNYENWGTTSYYIICDTFNDTEYKMNEWYKMVSSLPFKIKYTAYLRADLLDKFKDVPHLLKESGLVSCFHGIESLNRESALAVGKGWSGVRAKDYIPELYHDIWKKEVFQTLSFIAGLPGDSRENNIETADWHVANDLWHIIFNPLHITFGTGLKNLSEFELNAEKYGYYKDLDDKNYSGWKNNYWSMREVAGFLKASVYPKLKQNPIKIPSSWLVAQYIGLGYHESLFRGKSFEIPLSAFEDYILKYKNLLLNS